MDQGVGSYASGPYGLVYYLEERVHETAVEHRVERGVEEFDVEELFLFAIDHDGDGRIFEFHTGGEVEFRSIKDYFLYPFDLFFCDGHMGPFIEEVSVLMLLPWFLKVNLGAGCF